MWFLAMTICTATIAASPDSEPPRIPELRFEKYTLPNGLDVILHEDHSTPIVGVNVWYHVGSKDERPGRTGFAHLFEHMMFQGAKHYDKVYFGPLQTVGGRLNGSTAMDRTNYWETVPSNYLALALWMESDRMGFLLPAMTQPKLDNQRDVVKNERRQSYENRPYGLVHEVILAALYPPDDPYAWPPIGSMQDVTAASREDVADFFRRFYNAGNASLCIAGDFDPREAKQLVAKYFGPLPAGPKVTHPQPSLPVLEEVKRIEMTDHVGLARLYLVWPTPRQFTAEDADLEILAHVLAGSKVSRLYEALVRRKQIAQDVQAYQDGRELRGEFSIVVTARPGHSLTEIEGAVAYEVARIQMEPPTAEELARAVNSFESHTVRALESISEFGGRADRLNMYNVMAGDPGYMQKDFARYGRVTPEAVRQAAAKWLSKGCVVVGVVPGKELTIVPDPRQAAEKAREELAKQLPARPPLPEAVVDDSGRGPMPHGAQEPAFHLPAIQRARLSSGIEVFLVEKHELPLVTLHLVFPAGSAQDPGGVVLFEATPDPAEPLVRFDQNLPAQPGLAEMTAAVWDEGTRRRSAEQIATELTDLGATLSMACEWDATSARLFTLKRHLAKALDVYADVLREPAFPTAELARQRAMAEGRLAQFRNEPLVLAPMAVNQLLYGANHPYGHPQWGNPAVLEQFTPDALRNFYQTFMRPEQAGLIVVGDITMAELTAALENVLRGWASAGPARRLADVAFPPVPPQQPTRLVLVDKPGAAQSVIDVGLVGAARKSPEYFQLLVMNMVFGGQFSSRLNLNLREQKGYTYGARSLFEWRVHQPGPLVALASVQTAVTAPALTEFLKELEGMVGGRPVEAKELDFCQKYVTRGYAAGFETPSQIATQLETLFLYKLPDDYFNTVVPGVRAVTAGEVMAAAKKYLALDRLTVVVVGDRKAIEPALRKLPLGKSLTVLRFDENFHLVPAGE
ncbi:MAG: pitrilysin family protein [Thermoguttaceae bacterium]|jgi:zinc protease